MANPVDELGTPLSRSERQLLARLRGERPADLNPELDALRRAIAAARIAGVYTMSSPEELGP